MSRYEVYLEIAEDGRCLVHVLDLPGLVVRASTRDEALSRVPGVIGEYHAWLRHHGEPALSLDSPIEIEIVAESRGFGPFDRRNAAALFPPDRKPVSPAAMERHFRLLEYSRADLLGLVRHLPDNLLDWQATPQSFSIRELLRHVGNAEEWYVSRIALPETLPPEWEDDEGLPIFEFLAMSRRTALERVRQFGEEEWSGVFYPQGWTDHPEEPWTARKMLRRFLEHEREHTWQVREILEAHRRYLVARLAAERARLLELLLGLGEEALAQALVLGDWSLKDVIAHLGVWDRWEHKTMESIVAGQEPDFSALDDIDVSNAVFLAEWRDRSLEEIVTEMRAARRDWVAWLESLPVEAFYRPRRYGDHDWSFYADALLVLAEHDAEHAGEIASWLTAEEPKGGSGPRAVLVAALEAARHELVSAARVIPPDERQSLSVCGSWTLQDVLGHVTDWEWVGVEGLRHMAAGQPPQVEHIKDLDAWNQAHVEARRDQSWEVVWDDLHAAHGALLETLGGMDGSELAQTYPFPWGGEGSAYQWLCVFVTHDREHAGDLR